MRSIAGKRIAACVLLAAGLAAYARGAEHSLDALVQSVVQHGPGSLLPAHLSVVLGVSATERGTPVKQAVVRDGPTVRTFNVVAADHGNLVMLKYDEQTHETNAYLVSAAGALRKAVSYQAGAPAIVRSNKDARTDFGQEAGFWVKFEQRLTAPK